MKLPMPAGIWTHELPSLVASRTPGPGDWRLRLAPAQVAHRRSGKGDSEEDGGGALQGSTQLTGCYMDDGPGDARRDAWIARRTGSEGGCSEEGQKKQHGKKGRHTAREREVATIPMCFQCKDGVQT